MDFLNGIINHILPKSFVDGPGNRMVIFMQGCNFHCLYCHNPFTINRCNDCGICVPACPQHALNRIDGKVTWNQADCVECDRCVKICPNFSSPRIHLYSPEELWQTVTQMQLFISGVSVSGGEPSLQIPFLAQFFEIVKRKSTLNTLIETNGFCRPRAYQPLLPCLDMALVDLKSIHPERHAQLTGKSLEAVKDSIRFFAEQGKLYAVQQVIVPGFTDRQEEMRQTAQFLAGIDPEIRLNLLRFRPHGTSGTAAQWQSPSHETLDTLVAVAQANGLQHVNRSL